MPAKGGARQELLAALHVAMRNVSGQGVLFSQAMAERLGINSTDLECLDYVVLRGPQTAGALAEMTGLSTGAITGVIDRLERAGFAQRESDAKDRRKVLVKALPAVERRILPLARPMERAANAALARYSDDELRLLLDFLKNAHAASLTAMSDLKTMDVGAKPARGKSAGRGRPRTRSGR
jgi:DNA-binding MarR family transcriptional regulator